MKTAIRTILCAAAVVMASVSCQKSIEPATLAEEGKETIDICVNGLMGEYTQVDGTKAELVNTVRVSWKGGETVYVYDGTKCLGSLKASLEGTEDRYAILSTDGTHTVDTPADGTTTLTLVYSPLLTKAPTVNDGAISISLASQSGAKAPFVAYATLEYTGTTIKNAVVPFKFATSVIKVNCTGLKPGTAITSATLSNVNTECKLTLSGDKAPVVAGGTNGTITRTGDAYFAAGNVNVEGEAVFQIAVPALEAASEARVLTVKQGSSKVKDKNFSMKKIAAATSVNTVCQLVKVLPAGALKGVFTVSDPDGTPNSGDEKKVHFSKGNLYYDGSNWGFEEEQYYFRTYDGGGKCDAKGYSYGSGTASGHWGLFRWSTEGKNFGMNTSIDPFGYTGKFRDWGTAIDDNGTWKTLSGGSEGEWKYLFDHHINVWGTCNSVPGRFIAPDGFVGGESALSEAIQDWESAQAAGIVFFPAAGYLDWEVNYVGDRGFYWSSTALDDDIYEISAYRVFFTSQYVISDSADGSRCQGYSVRLITE